jgi:PAT family beta-lactamase induction signal transducer AmpG
MNKPRTEYRNGWFWVPSLYFAEGLPYVMVMTVSVIMYKRLGISNTDIAVYTSLLYLPWVVKPLWSPFVDILKTKRFWIITMQLIIALGLGGIAFTVTLPNFFILTLLFFWLLAFSSATHDIAADGFYMLGLTKHDQVWFVGFRSTFYRFAMIFAQGLLVIFAGYLEIRFNDIPLAWMISLSAIGIVFFLFFIYHNIILPFPGSDRPTASPDVKSVFAEFLRTFITFFRKEQILVILLFILFYRFGEGQLTKLASPFFLDPREAGGLALSTESVGFIYGTVGVAALTLGGLLGGLLAARKGLKYWIWWMLIAINLPDLVYVYLAFSQTTNLLVINIMVAIEQFGYGFGFTAFLLVLIYISEGNHKTAHYAIATGLMALGMMVPGMISGWMQSLIGYKYFFIWVTVSTIPAFIITAFLKIDPDFGKKTNES